MAKYYDYKDYTVIIGDIIGSKKIEDRDKVQADFKDILFAMNQKYADHIASKFTITLGDEFQGLLKNNEHVIQIIYEIEMAMLPIQMRFGVGIGEVSTTINVDSSSEIDGPAYHRARAMIEELEITERQRSKRQANILLASKPENMEIDQLLNSILSVCTALKSNWTFKQQEIIKAFLLNEENQTKTAEELGMAQSSVSRGLSGANFVTYQSAINTINTFLMKSGED